MSKFWLCELENSIRVAAGKPVVIRIGDELVTLKLIIPTTTLFRKAVSVSELKGLLPELKYALWKRNGVEEEIAAKVPFKFAAAFGPDLIPATQPAPNE